MSFVVAPEWVKAAAQDLTGLRSALAEASESIAAITTGIAPPAADEISGAIAAMFGGWGEEFQALSAQAQAFHAGFIRTLNSSVGAYLSAETAIAEALPAASILDGLLNPGGLSGGSGGLLDGLGLFNPGGLLGGLGVPSLNALLPGLIGAAPTDTPVSLDAITGPYNRLFSNTVANLQDFGNRWAANPFPFLRQVAVNQIGYGGIVTAAFSNAGLHLSSGAANLAMTDLASMAVIPARMGQNFLNVMSTLTDFSWSIGTNVSVLSLPNNIGVLQLGAAFFGLPMALGIDLIGTPAAAGSAMFSVVSSLFSAMQSGDDFGALVSILTAPAVVTDGLLNGHITFGLGLPGVSLPLIGGLGGITVPLTAQVPLAGLLSPLSTTSLVVNNPLANSQALLSVPLGGTPTGGLLQGMFIHAPQELAEAIGAPPTTGSLIPLPDIFLPGIGSLPNLTSVTDGLRGLLGGMVPSLGLPDLGGLLGGLGGGLPDLGGLLGGSLLSGGNGVLNGGGGLLGTGLLGPGGLLG